MGSIHDTRCECGHATSVTIGAGMRDFQTNSKFPFYCEECGLVDVNVSAEKAQCPKCHSEAVLQYGKPPISIPVEGDDHPRLSWDRYKAYWHGNLCPNCKQHTMRFGPSRMMFD